MIYSITYPIVWYTQSNKKYATVGSWKSTRFRMVSGCLAFPFSSRDTGEMAWLHENWGCFCSVVFFLKISITYKWEMIVGPTYGWIGKCGKKWDLLRGYVCSIDEAKGYGYMIYTCAFDSCGPDTNSNSGIPFLLEGAEVLMREYDTWIYMMQSCVFIYTVQIWIFLTCKLQIFESPSQEKN